jgi:uncharacterized protein (TIGR02001 family)
MNKLTKQLITGSALGATALLAAPTAVMADDVEVNMGVVSQYVLRGYAETSGPAVQGGIDYGLDSGVYVGTWWSSLENSYTDSGATISEMDFYAGYAGEAGAFDYDVGVVYYHYLTEDDDASDFSMPELYVSGGMGPLGLTLYTAMDDGFADKGDMYLEASYGVDLPADFGFGVTAGYAMPDDSALDSNLTDTTLSLSYPMGEAEGSANYMAGGTGTDDEDIDDKFWFGISWAY